MSLDLYPHAEQPARTAEHAPLAQVPCERCSTPTVAIHSRLCDRCWELYRAEQAVKLIEAVQANGPWYASHDAVCAMCRYLIASDRLRTAKEVYSFFEKPWHWQSEYVEFQASKLMQNYFRQD